MATASSSDGLLLATEKLAKEYRGRRVVNGVSVSVARAKSSGCSARTARARRRRSTWSSAW
jgi:hypothetical protein